MLRPDRAVERHWPASSEVARGVRSRAHSGNLLMLAVAQERFRRVGVLLTLVGWTWFLYELGYVYQPLPYTLSRLTDGLWQPFLAHLGVTFPSGRLRSRWDRLVVGFAYGLYGILTPIELAFWHSR